MRCAAPAADPDEIEQMTLEATSSDLTASERVSAFAPEQSLLVACSTAIVFDVRLALVIFVS